MRVGKTTGGTVNSYEFERYLLCNVHHDLLQLGLRTETDEPHFASGNVCSEIGGFVESVRSPWIEHGGKHGFVLERRAGWSFYRFESVQRIGHDAAAEGDVERHMWSSNSRNVVVRRWSMVDGKITNLACA